MQLDMVRIVSGAGPHEVHNLYVYCTKRLCYPGYHWISARISMDGHDIAARLDSP